MTMEPSVSNPYFFTVILVLIGLFVGLAIGAWLFSRAGVVASKVKKEEENTAFLKGVNYLLSNDHDHAIEEFIKAVRINSDTVETYIALGNLFRSKGEVGRAIRIHESIILRPTIDRETRIQAMYDLGMDFKKAGFIKRAISSLEDVIDHDPTRLDAHIQLEELYEDVVDWEKAYMVQERISRLRKTQDNNILAHLRTEFGKSFFAGNDPNSAKRLFKKAISLDPNCIDVLLHMGDLYLSQKNYAKAISIWKRVMKINPPLTHLVYDRLERAYYEKNKPDDFEHFLRKSSMESRDNSYIHLALAECLGKGGKIEAAIKELRSVIRINPGSMEARKKLGKILIEHGRDDELALEYEDLLKRLDMPDKRFRCQNCGFESENVQWKCPQCLKWDTIIPKELESNASIT